jgi:hypothetical protein
MAFDLLVLHESGYVLAPRRARDERTVGTEPVNTDMGMLRSSRHNSDRYAGLKRYFVSAALWNAATVADAYLSARRERAGSTVAARRSLSPKAMMRTSAPAWTAYMAAQ